MTTEFHGTNEFMAEYEKNRATNSEQNFEGCRIEDVSIAGLYLMGANFKGATLINVDLRRANLAGANLSGATIDDCWFDYADLSHADASGAVIEDSLFTQADLEGMDFSNARVIDTIFIGAFAPFSTWNEAEIQDTDFARADLWRSSFRNADIHDAVHFYRANLCDIHLNNTRINWNDHALIQDILLRSTEKDIHRVYAGAISAMNRHCWDNFERLWPEEVKNWAIHILLGYVHEKDVEAELWNVPNQISNVYRAMLAAVDEEDSDGTS